MTAIDQDDFGTIELLVANEFRRHVGIAVAETLRERATDPASMQIENSIEEEYDNRWNLLTPVMRLAANLKLPGYGDYQRAAFDAAVAQDVARARQST